MLSVFKTLGSAVVACLILFFAMTTFPRLDASASREKAGEVCKCGVSCACADHLPVLFDRAPKIYRTVQVCDNGVCKLVSVADDEAGTFEGQEEMFVSSACSSCGSGEPGGSPGSGRGARAFEDRPLLSLAASPFRLLRRIFHRRG